jgi:hypothetical protein
LHSWCGAFFLDFKNRIIEQYSSLFGKHIDDGNEFGSGGSFFERWGWYHSIVKIARGNYFDIERVEKSNLHFALTFLSYLKEQDEEEAKQINNKFKKNE